MSQNLRSSDQRNKGISQQNPKKIFSEKEQKKVEKLPLAQKLDLSPLNGASSGARLEDGTGVAAGKHLVNRQAHVFCRHIDFSLGTRIR